MIGQGRLEKIDRLLGGRTRAILGMFVVGAVVLVTFHPLVGSGFFAEDYVAVDLAARLSFPSYVASYLGQCVSAGFCRPAQGLGILIEYMLFGSNLLAYRFVQILIHSLNCVLLSIVVWQTTKKWSVGLLAALIYGGLPALGQAFIWFNVSDQAASFYYLGSLSFWLKYLESKRRVYYFVAIGAFVLSLANKEYGVTLPVALFLADRWLVQERSTIIEMIRRYLAFALICLLYGASLILRLGAFTKSDYTGFYAGVGLGLQSLANLRLYLTALAFPWSADELVGLAAILVLALLLLYLLLFKRDAGIAFLCVMAILPLLPVLTFTFIGLRYLYQSLMATAVLYALFFEFAYKRLPRKQVFSFALAGAVALVVLGGAAADAEAFDNTDAYLRQYRLPLRPLFQGRSNFPDGTYLYFVNSPIPTGILSGMVVMRYGSGVTVGGTDQAVPAGLDRHDQSFVYYFDDQNRPIEVPVEYGMGAQSRSTLPADFSIPIRLEGYEVASTKVKHGQSLVLLLYWRALGGVSKDYTLFAHLMNANGQMVAASDSQPQGGKFPTSSWRTGNSVVDWVVIPIADQVPVGDHYTLELGWYFLPTMERTTVVTVQGQVMDNISIGPFDIN